MTDNGKKSSCMGRILNGVFQAKNVKIWLKLDNFDVFLSFTFSDALYFAVLDRKSSASLEKTPTNINVKNCPLKKQKKKKSFREEKKSSRQLNYRVWRYTHSGKVYEISVYISSIK